MSPSQLRTELPPEVATGGPAVGDPAASPRSAHVVIPQLRSPITAILGFTETLVRSAERGTLPPEKLIDRLSRIRESALRINGLVDELDRLPEQAPRPAK